LLDQILAELFVAGDDGLARVEDQLIDLFVHLSRLLLVIVDGSQQNLEGHH
jgi:hypothetical protein